MTAPYTVHLTEVAKADLARLDKVVAGRVVRRIQWLAENIENTPLQPLVGPWQGLYKLRVGDYRVLYRIERQEVASIVVEFVRHRREVYK